MSGLLMPKATAVWLVESTSLTFDQIAAFCGMHPLEIQAIADDEVAQGIVGFDPVTNGQLTHDEIERCQADPSARLTLTEGIEKFTVPKRRRARYTPVSKRQNRPDAIAWLLKNQPELSDSQISKLLGTTKPTINAVRERTHWNAQNIKPQDPVQLGMCTAEELNQARAQALKRQPAAPEAQAETAG
ncbi:MAG: cell cycle transcriptional regulator TrcR [Alphaproteobacteria bacterium]